MNNRMRFLVFIVLCIAMCACGGNTVEQQADTFRVACKALDSLRAGQGRIDRVQAQLVKKDESSTTHLGISKDSMYLYEEGYRLSTFDNKPLYELVTKANDLLLHQQINTRVAKLVIEKLTDKHHKDSLTALVNGIGLGGH